MRRYRVAVCFSPRFGGMLGSHTLELLFIMQPQLLSATPVLCSVRAACPATVSSSGICGEIRVEKAVLGLLTVALATEHTNERR